MSARRWIGLAVGLGLAVAMLAAAPTASAATASPGHPVCVDANNGAPGRVCVTVRLHPQVGAGRVSVTTVAQNLDRTRALLTLRVAGGVITRSYTVTDPSAPPLNFSHTFTVRPAGLVYGRLVVVSRDYMPPVRVHWPEQ
jgi:hypothetical protein